MLDIKTIIEELQARFLDITHIAHLETYEDGRLLFTCIERDKQSLLTIDPESWILIKNFDSTYWDVLGSF